MNSFYAFTLKGDGLLDMLKTPVTITSQYMDQSSKVQTKKWRGLWDTGASKSSIDKRVADEMKLIPIGQGNISTANGVVTVNTYYVDLILPNNVTAKNNLVTGANLGDDIDVLIGMDIIKHGDFAITNVNGKTTFSFRMPSLEQIDYAKQANQLKAKAIKEKEGNESSK